jgi:hypothetical protein
VSSASCGPTWTTAPRRRRGGGATLRACRAPRWSCGAGTGSTCTGSEPYLIDDAGDPPPIFTEFVEQGEGKKKRPRHFIKGKGGERVCEFLPDPRTGRDSKRRTPEFPEVSDKGLHVQHVLQGIAAKIGGDHTQDLARLLRLPCTLNRKDERNGKAPVPCEVVECDASRRYPLSLFEPFPEASPDLIERKEVAKIRLPTGRKLTQGRQDGLNDLINRCAAAEVGARSERDFHLCCWSIEEGLDPEEVWAR